VATALSGGRCFSIIKDVDQKQLRTKKHEISQNDA